MININPGKIEIVFLQSGLGVFPAQPLTGRSGAPTDVVGPGTRLDKHFRGVGDVIVVVMAYLSSKVMVNAGVLELLPVPLVLDHAGEPVLHARHVGRVVEVGGARGELAEEEISLVY